MGNRWKELEKSLKRHTQQFKSSILPALGLFSSKKSIQITEVKTQTKKQSYQRLQPSLWKPNQEFKPRRFSLLSESIFAANRIIGLALHGIVAPRSIFFLGTAATVVFGIGFWEGYILCKNPTDWVFVVRYALENVITSCVVEERNPELIVRALGKDPNDILISLNETKQEDAQRIIWLQSAFASRSVIASNEICD